MRFIKANILPIIFFAGLLIRLLLMFTFSSFDINNHISWAQDLYHRGFPSFYETQSSEIYAWQYPNYPPLAIYIFYLVYIIKQPIFNILWWLNLKIPLFPSKIFEFLGTRDYTVGFYKIPAIIFDLVLAYLIYLFAKKLFPKENKKQIIAVALILFNPIFIYMSSLWGQIESIVLSFFLVAIYLLVFSKKPILSFVFFVLAFLVKPVIIIFLPVYLIYFLKTYGWKKGFISLAIGDLIFWFSFLPFYKNGNILIYPYLTYFDKILTTQSLSNVSNSAFNFWSIIPSLLTTPDITLIQGLITYRSLGYLLVAIFYLLIIIKIFNKIENKQTFIYSLFLTGFSYLMFSTKMHERYFIYLLPLIFLTGLINKKYFKWVIILSIIFFLNLYYSWSIPYADFIGGLKNNLTIITLSIIMFISFGYLFVKQNDIFS